MSKPTLKLDWCSHAAAKYAVENWHYSKTMPVSKCVKIGAWENGTFVGCVLFAWGANPNLSKPYGLKMTEVAELVRVAFTKHETSISRSMAIAKKMLMKQSPGLRLLVSYADCEQGHHGGIYQASNWIYTGTTAPKTDYVLNGIKLQRRAYTGSNFGQGKMQLPVGATKSQSTIKHRYLMPLDDEMRDRIEPLRKPYPKRAASADSGTPGIQPGGGGANPTAALLTEGGAHV